MILGHIGPVFCVAFSSDGRELASGGADMQIRVWDAKQGKERRVLRGHKGLVWNLAFSPNGARLASLSWDHNLRIWDAQSGQEILAFYEPTGEFRGLSFSGDGRYLAAGGNDDTVRIWDAGPLETRHGSAAKIAPPISIQQKSAASGETGEAP
jgi:WD40 repeat protein